MKTARPVIHNRDHRRGGADQMNGRWYYVGEADAPAFENSWDNAGGGLGVVRFALNDDELTIHGAAAGGSTGTVIFTLPVTHRPAETFVKVGALTVGEDIASITVDTDGTVTLNAIGDASGLSTHVGDTSGAHAASAISADSSTLVGTGTNAQAVFEELDNAIADHVADPTAAHAGTAISNTPAGGISGTTMQAAINELDSEKQPIDGTLTALAAANWAANALPIGTGADALSQTAFAANTFPARASTGNLVAKPITDFGLSLVDDTDQAAARATLGIGSGGDTDVLTTAGDLLTQDPSGTYVRLPVGSTGEVLTVSGGGLPAWGAGGGGGGAPTPGFRTGQTWYYVPTGQITTAAGVLSRLEAYPCWLPSGLPIDRLGVAVTTGGGTNSVVRMGIYSDSGYGYPGALLIDGGTVITTVAAGTGAKEVTISQTIPTDGWYWLAYVAQVGTVPVIRRIDGSTSCIAAPGLYTTFTTAPGSPILTGYTVASVTGALPNPFGTPPLTLEADPARVYIRVT